MVDDLKKLFKGQQRLPDGYVDLLDDDPPAVAAVLRARLERREKRRLQRQRKEQP